MSISKCSHLAIFDSDALLRQTVHANNGKSAPLQRRVGEKSWVLNYPLYLVLVVQSQKLK